MSKQPLVTIGIPTYNRPEGLYRTLESITAQTFKNIEIIVSDNCSENKMVKDVIDKFRSLDSRIISFTQETNIGVIDNFKFVLQKSTGDYFMWAADDDEWSTEFISELMLIIGDHSAAFSNYSIKHRMNGQVEHIKIKESAMGNNKYEQARNFLRERIPSLFYGLYRTKDIKWFINTDKIFDWFDCYLIFKTILLDNGFAFSDKELYTAGMHGSAYEYKPLKPNGKRIFNYAPYFIQSSRIIFQSEINILQKIKLLVYLTDVNFRSFLVTEKVRKNYKFYAFLYKIYNRLRPPLYFHEH
ncbi:MAG TPA: glycosyltransferase family 2 protein [Puia sp.]|jgi:glycosyltransferase involved in cell wall biosynthesis|nr:glycosyltransferase family 2 protein [Puia sp.]